MPGLTEFAGMGIGLTAAVIVVCGLIRLIELVMPARLPPTGRDYEDDAGGGPVGLTSAYGLLPVEDSPACRR